MKQVQKGERISLLKEDVAHSFVVGIYWDQSACPQYEVDASVMLLSERGKLEEEGNFVFYNNLQSLCGGVKMHASPAGHYKKSMSIDLKKIAPDISRMLFVMTIDNGDALNQRFDAVKSISADVVNERTQNAMLQYKVEGLMGETAVIAIEIYKKNNEWRLQATGSGFNAGLAALLKTYGSEKVQIEEPTGSPSPKPSPKPPAQPPAPPPPAPPPPAPPPPRTEPPPPKQEPRVSLSKITLQKKGDSTTIDLTKRDTSKSSEIHINLNWKQPPKKGGLFGFMGGESLDLDLGCMFEMLDGSKGVIQALGNCFGTKLGPPYIHLDKDDRTGTSAEGENLRIYRPDVLKRAAIFAYIYEGKLDFSNANAVLLLKGLGKEITVNLDSPRPRQTFCAGLYIENIKGDIKISKINEYVMDHKECDALFGFNFRWSAGSKD